MHHDDFVEELRSFQEIPLAAPAERPGLVEIEAGFPDPEGKLETAYAFARRLRVRQVRLVTARKETARFEEYFIETRPGECVVSAADSEGIRRGIYKFSDYLRLHAPEDLPKREVRVTPTLGTRMARYRFGSKKHSLRGHDDLLMECDLMPEGYLDRLAYEGVNAEILRMDSVYLSAICETRYTLGKIEEKRRRKKRLQEYVDKAARYGIRVFLYVNSPPAWQEGDPALEKYPELVGPFLSGLHYHCMASPDGKRYLYDCMHDLFASVRGLGGTLQIVFGEGAASCLTFLMFGEIPCQGKCGLSNGEIMASGFDSLFRGMKDANPNADLVVWYYDPFVYDKPRYREEWLPETLAKAPEGVIHQLNAESGIEVPQLGKGRVCGDYWQCEAGLSTYYRRFAEDAKKHHRSIFAKIQVGTSHEMGCVPYLEVPALTYRKYKNLQECGTDGVFQCWGAGATPGFMNYVARELAFTDCAALSEREFLLGLGRTFWGEGNATAMARVWTLFSEAYAEYPRANMVQYFGPVADGVTWPLPVYPRFAPLFSTWVAYDELSGDSIWECLDTHTLDELVILFGRMTERWGEGLGLLRQICGGMKLNEEQNRSLVLAEALDIHFSTAYRIARFFQLRRELFDSPQSGTLDEMRTILESEIASRGKMVELCGKWPLLGYNPEARGHKYDEAKISRSIRKLEATLRDELPRAERELRERTLRLEFPCKAEYRLGTGEVRLEDIFWSATAADGRLKITIHCPKRRKILDELFVGIDDGGRSFPWLLHVSGEGKCFRVPEGTACRFEGMGDGWGLLLDIDIPTLPGGSLRDLRINVSRLLDSPNIRCSWPGHVKTPPPGRLNLVYYHPSEMGKLLPE